MSQISYIQIEDDEDDDDYIADTSSGHSADAVATLDSAPFWSQDDDGFDFYTPDLNLPPSELNTSGLQNHPSRSRILVGSDPEPDPEPVPDSSVIDLDGGNQVMDLFGQRIEQSGLDPDPDPNWNPDFGGIDEDEDVPMDNLEMGLSDNWAEQSDLDPDLDPNWYPDFGDVNDDEDIDDGYSGFFCADCGDEFLESLGGSGAVSEAGDSVDLVEHDFFMGDLRGGDIELELGDGGDGVMDDFTFGDAAVDFGEESGLEIYLGDNVDVNNNQDFEWEEIGGSVDDRDVLSMIFEAGPNDDASVVPESGELGRERNETIVNLEWEVLLNIHNLEVNHGFGLDDDYGGYIDNEEYSIEEYATLFAQFGDNDNALVGRPPASKDVVENLHSVLVTEEDVENDNVICAVCKDEMNAGERAKQLPCSHRYHGDCILPWLGIRNTCPVCRYELPTDDPDYELRRRGLVEVPIQ